MMIVQYTYIGNTNAAPYHTINYKAFSLCVPSSLLPPSFEKGSSLSSMAWHDTVHFPSEEKLLAFRDPTRAHHQKEKEEDEEEQRIEKKKGVRHTPQQTRLRDENS